MTSNFQVEGARVPLGVLTRTSVHRSVPSRQQLMSTFTGVDSLEGSMRAGASHGVIFLFLPYFATMWP